MADRSSTLVHSKPSNLCILLCVPTSPRGLQPDPAPLLKTATLVLRRGISTIPCWLSGNGSETPPNVVFFNCLSGEYLADTVAMTCRACEAGTFSDAGYTIASVHIFCWVHIACWADGWALAICYSSVGT